MKVHKCYIRPINAYASEDRSGNDLNELENKKFIFFQLWTWQEKHKCENNLSRVVQHKINLAIAHVVCDE